MISILCPHCETTLTVEEQWRGKAISCIRCGKKLAVATAPPAAAKPEMSVSISADSAPTRRRKRGLGTRFVSAAMHLTITAATIYGGYYLISQRRANVVQAPPLIVEKPKPKATTKPTSVVVEQEDADDLEVVEEPVAPPEVVEATPRVSPFENLPTTAALPSVDDTTIVSLVENLPETELRLASNYSGLTHSDKKVLWRASDDEEPVTVAGLTVMEGALKFRWMAPISKEAETAVRNALVCLRSEEFEHFLSLRDAQAAERLVFDLKKPTQKIVCKCDFIPEVKDIRFELTGISQLPATQVEGADPKAMQPRDQSTLRYSSAGGAATRLTMKKRGNMAVVELESRYVLPSGDEQPMSIKRGNQKVQELDALLQEVKMAEGAIAGLKSRVQKLQSEIRGVPQSVATATAKAVRLNKLQNDLAAATQRLRYAEQLVTKKAAIEADHKAVHRIAEIAQQLHSAEVAYRFFTVVDDHEIDLMVGR